MKSAELKGISDYKHTHLHLHLQVKSGRQDSVAGECVTRECVGMLMHTDT